MRRWWKPAVQECGPARAACLPSRVHHRSPGVLAISSPRSRAARSRERQFITDQRSANRRTWRIQLAMLFLFPHRDTLGTVGCEATHNAEAASEAVRVSSRMGIHLKQFGARRRTSDLFVSLISKRKRGGGFHRRSAHRTGRFPAVSGLQCCWRSKDASSCHCLCSAFETAILG